MQVRYREEVFNVIIAQLLHQRGIVATPEQILNHDLKQDREMPDVIVQYNGLRTIIEGRIIKTKSAQDELIRFTRQRVQKGIGQLGIAIIYPESFRSVPFDSLSVEMAKHLYKFAIISEVEDVQLSIDMVGFPAVEDTYLPVQWTSGNLDGLGDLLRRTYEKLLKEDVVRRAADNIRIGIADFSGVILASQGSIERCAKALGIRASSQSDKKNTDE